MKFTLLSIVLAVGTGIVDLQAQSLSTAVDPVCGIPRLNIRGQAVGETYQLLASDGLDDPAVWETVLRLSPGTEEHRWFDPDNLNRGRRFYRLERLQPTPEVQVDNFSLLDQRGVRRELFREGDAKAVVLVFTDLDHLQETRAILRPLQDEFQPQGIRFWVILAGGTRGELETTSADIDIPVLQDEAQIVSKAYGARTLNEVVAIGQQDLTAFYRGSIGDRPVGTENTVDQPYLQQSLGQFLAAKPVVVQSAHTRRNSLNLNSIPTPSYARDIVPILQQKCISCHRPGDIGSFAMTNHTVLLEHAGGIRRQVLNHQMPPWHADPAYGRFANDISLTPDETRKLVAWVDAGSPQGDGPDPLTTQPPTPTTEWPLGTPDKVLSIPVQTIPASGEIPYRYLIVNNPLKTDVWLRAATVKPGNRAVVHHCLVFTASSLLDLLQVKGGLGGFFAGYVPGAAAVEFPSGTGKKLKAGSYLVFQMHYTPNGQETEDATQIGLYFASQTPARELTTTAAYDTGFQIPAGSRDHEVTAETVIATDSVLHEMSPHMHYRGSRMRFEAIYPNGTQETLLSVPGYDFAWQTLFRLAEPKKLPAGTRIRVIGGFDNSRWNPWNPNPQAVVGFGEQTSEEMMIGYLNLTPQ